ncbi:hypothetical protein T265_11693 [Opisthorchis viverrini]|uniref:Uncharacterized protein n=1 Tax=Opisthorchis viverrini TaxID=6198 RepID=A0A074YXP9_OPIVI|nr:hypothetical protein T265_11693 [Opisthorchis viverrini]KER19571.1 hypothetical protein T265_11693 [Opisthorchis viverrini]
MTDCDLDSLLLVPEVVLLVVGSVSPRDCHTRRVMSSVTPIIVDNITALWTVPAAKRRNQFLSVFNISSTAPHLSAPIDYWLRTAYNLIVAIVL